MSFWSTVLYPRIRLSRSKFTKWENEKMPNDKVGHNSSREKKIKNKLWIGTWLEGASAAAVMESFGGAMTRKQVNASRTDFYVIGLPLAHRRMVSSMRWNVAHTKDDIFTQKETKRVSWQRFDAALGHARIQQNQKKKVNKNKHRNRKHLTPALAAAIRCNVSRTFAQQTFTKKNTREREPLQWRTR